MQSFKVILKPIISEKALKEADNGEYTFEVDRRASKEEIIKAIKKVFEVDVKTVKTRITKNRSKRMLRSRQRTFLGPIKKATVKLAKDQKIDIYEVKE
jgi:large subunit ribosomal protein L23